MPNRREFLEAAGVALAMTGVPAAAEARSTKMTVIVAADAPKAIGPYSHAIRAGDTIYASGQIALDPATGQLVQGDFAAQVRRVFDNLKAVLHAAGTDFSHVVKTTVYLADVANFAAMNAIYAEYFGEHKPARTTVGVAQLPRGAALEVDVIAVV